MEILVHSYCGNAQFVSEWTKCCNPQLSTFQESENKIGKFIMNKRDLFTYNILSPLLFSIEGYLDVYESLKDLIEIY